MIWVQYAIFGLGIGAVFALLAAGIVLVYRAGGVLNFAHASMAMTAAFFNFELLERYSWMPVGLALLLSVAFGALLGVLVHRLVFVPVARAPQVVKLIVSFGVAGVLQGGVGLVWARLGGPPSTRGHSLLPVEETVSIGGAGVPHQRLAMFAVAVLAALGLAMLLRGTGFGMQLRALAQNPVAARLAGIDDRRIEAITWALAGASAALAGVLIAPFLILNPLAMSGFQLTALAAALLGGFASLVAALVGGLGLGVAQELLRGAPSPLNGLSSVLPTVLILGLLLARVERFFVSEQEARAVQGDERLFSGGSRTPALGSARTWLIGAAAVGVVTLTMSGFWTAVTTRTVLYALLGLSLVVLTGWTGQVSLMPGTFAGVGACLAWVLGTRLGYDFALVVPLAALATIPVCALAGLVALRLRPLYLAVATLALAGLFDETLFQQGWFANRGATMTLARPFYLEGDHAFAFAVLLIAGGLFAFTAAFGRSRTGRALRMVRDNERAAEAAGLNPVKYRLLAFAVSAAYAGVMGALLAYLLGAYSVDLFSFLVLSLSAFGLTIVGGVRSPVGAVVGAFLFIELTEIFRSSGSVSDISSIAVGAGIVAFMAVNPDGLVGIAQRLLGRRERSEPSTEAELVTAELVPEATSV